MTSNLRRWWRRATALPDVTLRITNPDGSEELVTLGPKDAAEVTIRTTLYRTGGRPSGYVDSDVLTIRRA